jgi:hypothetical protein
MNKMVQHDFEQDAMTDFEVMKKIMEDDSIRKIHSPEEKRHPERTKRFVEGPLRRQWSQRMNFNDTCCAPSLFTWRC